MATNSLFQPAAHTDRHLKVLLHGGPGVGKTRAALSFPGPVAVLDLEGGTALYAGFDVLRTKDLARIEAAITEIGQGGKYRTLVIDPLTVLWQLLQDAGQGIVDRKAKADSTQTGQSLSYREWGLIKRKYGNILTRCNNLPCNVVLIARDADLYEQNGDQIKRVGIKADVEKSTPYVADLVLRLEVRDGKHSAVVEKSRAAGLAVDHRLTGWAAGDFYAHCLAPVLAAIPQNAAPAPLFEEDSAVVAGNATLLEAVQIGADEKAPPPLEEYYQRIGVHLARLQVEGRIVADLIGALTDGHYTALEKITDRALLKQIGVRLAAMKTDDDLQRFWAAQPGPARKWDQPAPLPPAADAEEGEVIAYGAAPFFEDGPHPAGATVPPAPGRDGQLVTDKQLRAIYAIARAARHLTENEVDARCQELYGTAPSDLSKNEASAFIDTLKGEQAA